MKTKLVARVALTAGAVASLQADVAKGGSFEVDAADAEQLLTAGQADLAGQAATSKERQVRVRVLVDCEHGKANDLAELSASAAKEAEKAGQVDSDKAAVEYAASLPQNQPKPKAKA